MEVYSINSGREELEGRYHGTTIGRLYSQQVIDDGITRNADGWRRAITEKLGQIRVIPGTRAGDGTST
jgi:hypothetical protein